MTNLDSILKKKDIIADKGLSYGFSSSHVSSVIFGPLRRLSVKELMLLNCGAGEDFSESLGLQSDQTSQS